MADSPRGKERPTIVDQRREREDTDTVRDLPNGLVEDDSISSLILNYILEEPQKEGVRPREASRPPPVAASPAPPRATGAVHRAPEAKRDPTEPTALVHAPEAPRRAVRVHQPLPPSPHRANPSPDGRDSPIATRSYGPVEQSTSSEGGLRTRPAEQIDQRLFLLREPGSLQSSGFRVLRDNLLAQGAPRVLLVTSPEAGDGKTTCAVNLALAFAEAGVGRVLLVEGNYREPTLHTLFEVEDDLPTIALPGPYRLTEVLSSLHVATFPRPGANSAAAFDPVAFAALISGAGSVYDRVIVDGPQALGASTAQRIAERVDGVLFVARAGQSTSRTLRRAVEQVGQSKAVGTVLVGG